jgi:hypothetical protein
LSARIVLELLPPRRMIAPARGCDLTVAGGVISVRPNPASALIAAREIWIVVAGRTAGGGVGVGFGAAVVAGIRSTRSVGAGEAAGVEVGLGVGLGSGLATAAGITLILSGRPLFSCACASEASEMLANVAAMNAKPSRVFMITPSRNDQPICYDENGMYW